MLSLIADSIIYSHSIQEIILKLEDYLFTNFNIIIDMDSINANSILVEMLYANIAGVFNMLIYKYAKTYTNVIDTTDYTHLNNSSKFFLFRKFNCFIENGKSNINMNIILLTSKYPGKRC